MIKMHFILIILAKILKVYCSGEYITKDEVIITDEDKLKIPPSEIKGLEDNKNLHERQKIIKKSYKKGSEKVEEYETEKKWKQVLNRIVGSNKNKSKIKIPYNGIRIFTYDQILLSYLRLNLNHQQLIYEAKYMLKNEYQVLFLRAKNTQFGMYIALAASLISKSLIFVNECDIKHLKETDTLIYCLDKDEHLGARDNKCKCINFNLKDYNHFFTNSMSEIGEFKMIEFQNEYESGVKISNFKAGIPSFVSEEDFSKFICTGIREEN